jgi:hypothetical protein
VNYKFSETVRIAMFTALKGETNIQFGVNKQLPKEMDEKREKGNNSIII